MALVLDFLKYARYQAQLNKRFVHPILGFWSLLVKKLQKYENITQSLFTFCKARWARQKKWKENHTTKVTKIPKDENMG